MTDLYLRDLSGDLKEEVEKDLYKHRPDLVQVLEENKSPDCECEVDIVVGQLFSAADYKALN